MPDLHAVPGAFPGARHGLRVATYNVYLGADLEPLFAAASAEELVSAAAAAYQQVQHTDFRRRAPAIANVLAREAPDLVGLQEVARWAHGPRDVPAEERRATYDFLPLLLTELARRGLDYEVAASNAAFHGTAAVSASEVVQVAGYDVLLARSAHTNRTGARCGSFDSRLTIRTGVPGVGFEVRRGWCSVDVMIGDTTVRVVNTHLEAWDRVIRRRQASELARLCAPSHGPVVVLGDLNTEPRCDDAYGVLTAAPGGYVDAWRECRGAGGGATFGQAASLDQKGNLTRRIDYVLHCSAGRLRASGVHVAGAATGDRTVPDEDRPRLWPSDHAAVVADLEVREPTRTL